MPDEEIILNLEEKEVRKNYEEYRNKDPFPAIPPSLLNTSHIYDYVIATGLISPFYPGNLKQASYGVRLTKGEYIYWTSETEFVEGKIEDITEKDMEGNKVFTLKKNAIAFLPLEPEFKFPHYIAARFNLKIKHIYQGLLLGTGPIVDPGFEGKLYIPLHNLTNNDYKIPIEIPIIWMEFTKISNNFLWTQKKGTEPVWPFKEYIRDKGNKTLRDYLKDASPNNPIVSTLPDFSSRLSKLKDEVKDLVSDGRAVVNQFNYAIIIALSALFVTFIVALGVNYTNQEKYLDYIKQVQKQQLEMHEKIINEKNASAELRSKVDELDKRLKKYEKVKE